MSEESAEAFRIDDIIETGLKNRSVGGTQANAQSSRSHSIVTFSIQYKNDKGRLVSSKLNVIDLAGSERTGETNAQGQRLKEACQINKSLSVLTDVISSLARLKKGETAGFSRFRESKLTHFLKDSLGGNAYIMVIACISMEERVAEDSMRTIEFAKNVKSIKL